MILTVQGLEKFLAAKSTSELAHNAGNRYTLEQLSEQTSLSVDTLMRVLKCEVGVDKETLKSCFRAFQLALTAEDYTQPPLEATAPNQILEPELPGGQVPLQSQFYVERPPVEGNCYKLIAQPGALIRIKALRQMGKTSLIARILQHAETLGYRTVPLNFQLAHREVFQNLDQLLRWFCINVTLAMQLPNQLETYWDEALGSKVSSKIYFEQYLLANTAQPMVLSLDELDQVFQYPELTNEFLGLLRAWHEGAKNLEIWKKLRLIVAYCTEVAVPISLNQSPLNVGLSVELKPFSEQQVQELVRRYGLPWAPLQIEQLTTLVSGHPYLIQTVLYRVSRQEVTLEQLFKSPVNAIEILSEYTQYLFWQPEAVAAAGLELDDSPVLVSQASEALRPELPEGSVRLGSRFYVERAVEPRCYQAISKLGALIRIKAPRQMGKTSLMTRIVEHATKLGYRTVRLNLGQADEAVLSNLDRFLRWFCACISQKLQRPALLNDYWDQDRGSIFNCTTYMQEHLLEMTDAPLVLALDEVDRVFEFSEVAQGFFSMLRIWHEEAKTIEIWEQLRLVVAHSTEDYGRLDINQSPFNVGLPVELGEFTSTEVMSLAETHQQLNPEQVDRLMTLIGGHPYLVRLALYHLSCQDLSLEQLLSEATTNTGIYENHLRRHLIMLNQHPELAAALQQVVTSTVPIKLQTTQMYKLYSMGLIKRQGDCVTPRCELYRQYFRERLELI